MYASILNSGAQVGALTVNYEYIINFNEKLYVEVNSDEKDTSKKIIMKLYRADMFTLYNFMIIFSTAWAQCKLWFGHIAHSQ